MQLFRPSDVRVILALSILILAGSVLTLLKRQRIITSLDLGVFTEESPYKYNYSQQDLARMASPDSSSGETASSTALENDEGQQSININLAGFYDLQVLPGIGPVIAERIIAYRDSAGEFKSVEELMIVKGIGPAKFEKLKDKVIIR